MVGMTFPPENSITYFARTNFRNRNIPFGTYAIGKTGTGKSTLLETLIRQDIANGHGVALLDPHGDLVETIATSIPEHRKKDLIYFNVPYETQPFGYNPLKRVIPEKRPLAASGILEVFKKMWADFWGPRMEHVLRNALLALLDQPEATMPDIVKLIVNDTFRKSVAARVVNPQVREFWFKEYEKYSYRLRADAVAPIQNKVGAFLTDPNLYRMQTRSNLGPGQDVVDAAVETGTAAVDGVVHGVGSGWFSDRCGRLER